MSKPLTPTEIAKKRAAELKARQQFADLTEREYEALMNERIITESAEIRAEWDEQTRQSRRVGKHRELEVPRSRGGSKRLNGEQL
jgi:23S rRNA-/tRNA-specific pseudouridylate synthase